MDINELRIAGHFAIPDAQVDDDVDIVLRVRVYAIVRDEVEVSGFGGHETAPAGLRVQAVALESDIGRSGYPIRRQPPNYGEPAE